MQIGKIGDGISEIDEPTLVSPSFEGLRFGYREDEVGGSLPGLERRAKVGPKLFLRTKDELNLLATVLLERRNDLP